MLFGMVLQHLFRCGVHERLLAERAHVGQGFLIGSQLGCLTLLCHLLLCVSLTLLCGLVHVTFAHLVVCSRYEKYSGLVGCDRVSLVGWEWVPFLIGFSMERKLVVSTARSAEKRLEHDSLSRGKICFRDLGSCFWSVEGERLYGVVGSVLEEHFRFFVL